MVNVCGWTIARCGCGGCWDSLTGQTKERAAALATHFMWAATGRRYGLCEVTVMPDVRRPKLPLYRTYPLIGGRYGQYPYLGPVSVVAGSVPNPSPVGSSCCSGLCEVALDGPVASIVEVRIDGVVVDPGTYQVHDHQLLVRLGGECWPTHRGYGAEIPRFEVTYMIGKRIPPAVQAAAETLTCEYAKACQGDDACALPPHLTRLSRQGVEVTVEEFNSEHGHLRTGIRAIDDVLDADNPYGLTQAPTVLSPDAPNARTITWAGGS